MEGSLPWDGRFGGQSCGRRRGRGTRTGRTRIWRHRDSWVAGCIIPTRRIVGALIGRSVREHTPLTVSLSLSAILHRVCLVVLRVRRGRRTKRSNGTQRLRSACSARMWARCQRGKVCRTLDAQARNVERKRGRTFHTLLGVPVPVVPAVRAGNLLRRLGLSLLRWLGVKRIPVRRMSRRGRIGSRRSRNGRECAGNGDREKVRMRVLLMLSSGRPLVLILSLLLARLDHL